VRSKGQGDGSASVAVTLPPVERPTKGRLSVKIAEGLKLMILAGELRPGDKLPNESALCDHFGVSRVTIREAVQMLRALGLVEPTRGRGTFVREPDADAFLRDLAYFAFDSASSVVDLFEVRSLLECRAAQRAALVGPASERPALLTLVDEMKALLDSPEELDTVRLGQLDSEFHLRIAALSGNLVLVQLMNRVMQILEAVRARSLKVPGQPQRSWRQHVQIAEAILRGEPELAVARVVEHMECVKAAIINSEPPDSG
jgi:GntR family transcriptional repressor for pyruvate dehydrogenase complex